MLIKELYILSVQRPFAFPLAHLQADEYALERTSLILLGILVIVSVDGSKLAESMARLVDARVGDIAQFVCQFACVRF